MQQLGLCHCSSLLDTKWPHPPARPHAKHDFVKNKEVGLNEIVAPLRQIKANTARWVLPPVLRIHREGFLKHIPHRSQFLTFHFIFSFCLCATESSLCCVPPPLRHVWVSLCWYFKELLTRCRDSSMLPDLSEQGPHLHGPPRGQSGMIKAALMRKSQRQWKVDEVPRLFPPPRRRCRVVRSRLRDSAMCFYF